MSEYLSYAQFIKDRQNFRQTGTRTGNKFNLLDTPSHKYFKILFYFGEKASDDGLSTGLLAPTWEAFNGTNNTDYYNYTSAWAYLKANAEDERANKLEQFVTLLSNISTFSPWYFTSIGGLDAALTRSPAELGADKFEIETNRKLTITCLPDAADNRLSTLLELYREITWNWHQKKEVIPANLRKFDMAVYIFESPIFNWHTDNDALDADKSSMRSSYKMIEFHDCEINYNSIKSGWSELSNQTGATPTYTIEIGYSDCYDISYNELLVKYLGDIIESDTYQAIVIDHTNMNRESVAKLAQVSPPPSIQEKALSDIKPSSDGLKMASNISNDTPKSYEDVKKKTTKTYHLGNLEDANNHNGELAKREVRTEYKPGFLSNAVGQLIGSATKSIKSKFKKAVLGNLYTYSLTQIGSQLKSAAQGNLVTAVQTVKQYRKNSQQRAAAAAQAAKKPTGNIFKDNTIANNI